MLSMAVSQPLRVPRHCTPTCAHLTFALRLRIIPFSRKLRSESAERPGLCAFGQNNMGCLCGLNMLREHVPELERVDA
jgi:hypothetical protein